MQKFGFKWEDRPYEELSEEYPKCNSAIKWWCNYRDDTAFGFSFLNISYNKYLKEFLIQNPPPFKISNRCCEWAKKKVSHHYVKNNKIECTIIGVRKAEGGIRQSALKECYAINKYGIANYRPLLWFTQFDKQLYNSRFNILNSECYTRWGFDRTGCCGCPYAPKSALEVRIVEKYEPKIYKAINNIFHDSYIYTKQYREFVKEMTLKSKHKRRLF